MGNKREPFESDKLFHVYNHGNASDIIFREDKNYLFFLKKYRKYILPIADPYAYCLLPNHFHFMVKIKGRENLTNFFVTKNPQGFGNPEGLDSNLSNLISHQFGNVLNSYTKSFNNYYDRKGSLFINTTKRKPITDDIYFTQLIRYIHLNPVNHGFVRRVGEWSFTSYNSFLSDKETSLKREEVLDWFGGREEFIEAHRLKP